MSIKTQFTLLFLIGLFMGIVIESHVLSALGRSDSMPADTAGHSVGYRNEPSKMQSNVPDKALEPTLAGSPQINVDERVFDFGERDAGDIVEHAFTLTNSGTETLLIKRVLTSCGCTTAEVGSKSIPPGGSTALNVKVDLHSLRGRQNPAVLVQSNDPRTPDLQLDLRGNSIYHVDLSPPYVTLDSTEDGEPFTATVSVAADKALDSLNVQRTQTSGDNVEAELETVEEGRRYTVKVKVNPQQKPQDSPGWVRLTTDHPGEYKEINIPILTPAQLSSNGEVSKAAPPQNLGGPTLDAKVGETLELEGVDLAGGPISLSKYTGKPTAVIFWSSTCNACRGELGQLKQLHADYHDAGFQVLGVNLDKSVENRQQFLDEMALPWNTLVSKDDGTGIAFARRYKVRAIPSVVLLDASGKIIAIDKRGSALRQAVSELIDSSGGA
jgi:thiol-disulfide isomerase/thioredoxin